VHSVRGEARLNGKAMSAGDGAAVTDEAKLEFIASAPSEIMLFDLA
jgi:redox-sensitive bicupin YhaK (pirin superfamily)